MTVETIYIIYNIIYIYIYILQQSFFDTGIYLSQWFFVLMSLLFKVAG